MKIYKAGKITVMEPDEDKYLTNGECFSKMVFIGKNDSTDNWTETDYIPENEEK